MSVVARGDNASDVHNGDLTATGADLSGKNVTLQSGWDTTHSSSKGSSFGGAIGVEAGVTDGLSVDINGSGSHQHANGDSSSAVNTTVSATDKVTITAPGKTTINGAIVSGNQISVDTGNLDIISPQDTSHYNSSSSQVGGGLKVGVPGAGTGWGANGNYADQNIKDDYQSTGKQQSGLYAGDGGLQVHVDGTTYLKGGVMSSTGGDSYLDTGKLIAESQENHSKIDATSTGGGLNVGTDALGGSLGPLGMIAGNMASNSGLMTGGNRKQDDNSTTQSAISSEVKVKAGSTQGNYTTDVASADGHMGNNFDADKLSNELQNSQLGMQLVGEVMGQVSDALRDNGVPTFGEGGFGRLGLESAGNALIAAITGGDAGSAAAVTAAGGLVSAQTRLLAEQIGKQVSDDPQMQVLIANAISNAFASGGGALTDVAMGGDGLNGSSLASVMQAYNQSNDPNGGKMDETTQSVLSNLYDWALNTMEAASYFPVIGDPASLALALMYAAKGDFENAGLNLAAAAIGIFVAGEGKLIVKGGVLAVEDGGKWFTHTVTDADGNTIVYAEKNSAKGGGSSDKITVEESHGKVEGNVAGDSKTLTTPDGISFNINQPTHLATVDGFSQTKGISGGHNADAFYDAVDQYNLKIVSETPTGTPGITHVEYKIPAKDRAGNFTGEYKSTIEEKTIYDPKIYSDKVMLDLGQQAAAKGYSAAMTSEKGQATVVVDGVSFRIYVDKATGTVRSFHPN